MYCDIYQGLEGLIFGIRDLTKTWCRTQENDKFIDGNRDLTVPQEAGLTKNWARDAGFMFACLSGMPEIITTQQFLRPKQSSKSAQGVITYHAVIDLI